MPHRRSDTDPFRPADDPPQTASPGPETPPSSKAELEAQIIAEVFPAAMLASAAGKTLNAAVSPHGYQAYLQNLIRAAGDPKDPLEIMLIQQLATAHQRIGDLHAQSACASTPDLALAFSQAAAKLMCEFRKSTLALRQYRSPIVPKQVTLVTGNEQVALVDGEAGKRPVSEKTADSELGTKQPRLNHADLSIPFPAANCSAPEPVEAKRPDPRRPGEAQTSGDRKPALEALHGPQNGRG